MSRCLAGAVDRGREVIKWHEPAPRGGGQQRPRLLLAEGMRPPAPRAQGPHTQTASVFCAACRDAHLACQKEGGGDQGRQAVAVNGLGGVL